VDIETVSDLVLICHSPQQPFVQPTMPAAISSTVEPPEIWHTQNYYDEDAERISNIIDEGLKVSCFVFLSNLD
jgi:hypothetical protein